MTAAQDRFYARREWKAWAAGFATAATLTTTAQARTQAQVIHSLRSGIQWERGRTWHWQNVAGVERSPTVRGAGRWHSPGYLRWVEARWNRRRLAAYKLAHRPRHVYRLLTASGGSVQQVICQVFGAYCGQALAVARCESGFSIHAVNGQYLGLFQMGSSERTTYATIGYSTAYEQTVAAHNYFAVAGWGPWSCKP